MPTDTAIGDIVMTKKQHPCGGSAWAVTRAGADMKLKCVKCGHTVMLPRDKFEKAFKKYISKAETDIEDRENH